MENEEKLKINIYPLKLEIQKDNNENKVLKITENFTNDSKPEKIYENVLAQNAPVQNILEKNKDQLITSLNKLISASTINPNKEFH